MQRVIRSSEPPAAERHRRSARRVPSSVEVEVLAPRAGTGVVLNASSGGARVAVDWPLRRGELVELRLKGQSGVSLVDTMRVVWSREVADGFIAGLARLPLA